MPIKKFCEAIVYCMNGWLEHLYVLNYHKQIYECRGSKKDSLKRIAMGTKKLDYLNLQAKDTMVLEYDLGDGWEFKIRVQKINPGYNEKNFIVLSGKGKGIIEDCGGLWGLKQFIDGTVDPSMEDWYLSVFEEDHLYDINDFSVSEINHYLDTIYNKRKHATTK